MLVAQQRTALVYPPIDFGLTATQAAAPDTAQVALKLVEPGSGSEAEELEPDAIWCRGGSIGTQQAGNQEQARHGERAERCQHYGSGLDRV